MEESVTQMKKGITINVNVNLETSYMWKRLHLESYNM